MHLHEVESYIENLSARLDDLEVRMMGTWKTSSAEFPLLRKRTGLDFEYTQERHEEEINNLESRLDEIEAVPISLFTDRMRWVRAEIENLRTPWYRRLWGKARGLYENCRIRH